VPPNPRPQPALVLVCGDDDFAVGRRARQLYDQWCADAGGFDHEILDARASNSGEALRAIARLREALQTLPFFGQAKVVWLRDCTFLGEDRTAGAKAVTEAVAELAQELKAFAWDNVRLLISAGKVDKRKVFYKTIEKAGTTESYTALAFEDKDWLPRAESFARQETQARQKTIAEEALLELVQTVGPDLRQLSHEVEKLSLYVGARGEIAVADVRMLVTRQKHARAFALGDALGDRDLPRLLRTLDEELWGMKFDREKSPIGFLYGLIAKVRVLLFLKELLRLGLLRPERSYDRFKVQLGGIPAGALPDDRRYNPLAMNPYVLFKALPQTANYSTAELVRAMERLLRCNLRLVSSSLDDTLLLQQTLVEIVGRNH